MNSNVSIKKTLRILIDKEGYTLTWIARDLGVSYHTVYSWYTGKRRAKSLPNKHLIKRLLELA